MKRSKFSMSNYKLLTADMGNLIPINWMEILPGDSVQQATNALIRCSPLLAPVMHPVRVRIHHMFVAMRHIWEDSFSDFITGGEDGADATVHPYIDLDFTVSESSLLDYLGIPPADYSGNSFHISALPVRAYQLIWNSHYRDQQISTEAVVDTSDGEDTTTELTLKKVAWEKDCYSTARPNPQLGSAVTIPLGSTAPVVPHTTGDKFPTIDIGGSTRDLVNFSGSTQIGYSGAGSADASTTEWVTSGLEADLSSATGIDITELREMLALQRYQEARNLYGARIEEYVRYAFGVRQPERLSGPAYLGGGRQVISFSEVLSTDGANTGDLKGHGIAAMRTNRYRRFFDEHGICMTLMSVVPKAIYNDSVHKSWLRTTKEDYFQRELQFIGEEELLNREVYSQHSSPTDIFGYVPRYDSYRSLPSSIHGEFRTTLDHWHFGRIYGSDPALNSTWLEANPTKEPFASSSTDCLYIMANNSIQARRVVSKFAKAKTF